MCDFVGTAVHLESLTPAEVRALESWASQRQTDLSKRIIQLQEEIADTEARLRKADRAHDRVQAIVSERDENGRAKVLVTGVKDR